MTETITKHLRIHGRVQGVGYRHWASQTAGRFRLTGWVRNRKDSSVEAMITGLEDDVQYFISECYKGPPMAQVELISVHDGVDQDLEGFEVRETA